LPQPLWELKADYYVFATDVPGVQQLFTRMTGEVNQLVRSQVEKLSVADPLLSATSGLTTDFEEHSHFTSLSGYQRLQHHALSPVQEKYI